MDSSQNNQPKTELTNSGNNDIKEVNNKMQIQLIQHK